MHFFSWSLSRYPMELMPQRYEIHLEAYSHGFRVTRFNDDIRQLLVGFCRLFVKAETNKDRHGRYVDVPKKVFATATIARDQYFFHINVLEKFYEFFEFHRIPRSRINVIERSMYEPACTALEWINHAIILREYQNEAVDFVDKEKPRTKMINIQAGQGKTLTLLAYINHAQLRTVLIMKPMYMKQWKKEILSCFKINKGDFYIIGGDGKEAAGGAKALRSLIQLAKEDPEFNPSIIMISNATYRDYLSSFRMNPQQCKELYGCYPWEFFELMNAGLVAVDEVHQDFHFNFLLHCFSNIYKFAAMSATMKSDDPAMNRFYRIMFPQDTYAPAPPLKKYIDVYEVFYRFDREDLIRYRVRNKYHQATFEKSIMRSKRMLANYVNMIGTMVDHQFFRHRDYRPGMKILVYADRVEMCTAIADALKAKFPDRKVTRFCATVDKEENLYGEGNEVIVTTLKSCGTARDVKDVAVGLATIGISGLQASDQLIHRLREFKRPEWQGITPRFIFLGSRGNDKHLKYAEDRTSKLKHVVKNFNTMTSTFII